MGSAFSVVPGEFAVSRLEPDAIVPAWAESGPVVVVGRTAEELSIVCEACAVPAGIRSRRGWAMLKLRGPFAFDEVGVLASLASPLAAAGIPIFAVSTFDTDYVLVPEDRLSDSVTTLVAAGHREAV